MSAREGLRSKKMFEFSWRAKVSVSVSVLQYFQKPILVNWDRK